jgi:aryl-alcohol dehydrogenase-like predicted oxidoreductase
MLLLLHVDVQVATKFAPLPWRFTPDSVVHACEASLKRLQMRKVTLYMQHWCVATCVFSPSRHGV